MKNIEELVALLLSPFRNINSWVALEKIEGPEFELVPTGGQYRPVFRPNHVMKSERIPQYNIGILNLAIGARPGERNRDLRAKHTGD